MKSKSKKAIRAGNRIGKSTTVQDIDKCCNQALPKPRRSIPLTEVNQMIEREVSRVKSEKTIYDDRNDILSQIDAATRDIEYYEEQLFTINKRKLSLQQDLRETNIAISRELELDALR
jgi:hypothetical protein